MLPNFHRLRSLGNRPAMESVQEVCEGMLLGTPVREKGPWAGQREKLNGDAAATKAFST